MKRFPLPLLLLGCLGALAAHAQTVVQNITYNSTVTVSGPSTIDTCSNTVTAASGANVTYQATTSIRLGPGFTAANGSTFHAMLVAAPSITSPTFASGTVGAVFNYTITAANSPTSFGAAGLPGNFTFNSATGAISGTPAVIGTFNVILSASNGYGTGTRLLTLSFSILGGADADGDGINDQVETILGTNSAVPTTANGSIDVKVHRPN
jgi:Putative Ig domain